MLLSVEFVLQVECFVIVYIVCYWCGSVGCGYFVTMFCYLSSSCGGIVFVVGKLCLLHVMEIGQIGVVGGCMSSYLLMLY